MDRVVGPRVARGRRQAVRVARLDEDPGRPDDLRQRARRPTRRPARPRRAPRSPRARPSPRAPAGSRRARRATSAAAAFGRQARRVGQQLAHALARRGPRQRRPVLRRRAQEADARRPGDVGRERRGPAGGGEQPASARSSVAEVLAGVEPAGVDEVARRQAQPRRSGAPPVPGASGGAPRSARRGRPRASRRRGRYAGRGASGIVRRRSRRTWSSRRALCADGVRADDHRRGVAQQPARRRCPKRAGGAALVALGQLPRREVEQRDDHGKPGRRAASPPRPRGRRRRRPRRARPASRRRATRRAGGTGRPSGRRSAAAGSAAAAAGRRPTRRANRSVGSSRSDGSRNANDSPASGVGVEAASSPSR